MHKVSKYICIAICALSFVCNSQIFEPFSSFNGVGEWSSPGGNTGSLGGYLTFNVTGDYLDNEFYIFQSPIYDFSTYNEVEVLWYQKSNIRTGDVFALYFYDNGWFYLDISNLTGFYTVTLSNTTQAFAFVLNTIGGNGLLNGKYADVDFIEMRNTLALPVELLSFEAEAEQNTNNITWSTASEHNSLSFKLYKSKHSYNWQLINQQQASGFSNTKIDYKYLDTEIEQGYTYYKLVQVDIDGTQESFNPIYVYRINSSLKMYSLLGKELNKNHKGLYIDEKGKFNYKME